MAIALAVRMQRSVNTQLILLFLLYLVQNPSLGSGAAHPICVPPVQHIVLGHKSLDVSEEGL